MITEWGMGIGDEGRRKGDGGECGRWIEEGREKGTGVREKGVE